MDGDHRGAIGRAQGGGAMDWLDDDDMAGVVGGACVVSACAGHSARPGIEGPRGRALRSRSTAGRAAPIAVARRPRARATSAQSRGPLGEQRVLCNTSAWAPRGGRPLRACVHKRAHPSTARSDALRTARAIAQEPAARSPQCPGSAARASMRPHATIARPRRPSASAPRGRAGARRRQRSTR
jgi:hypothetical protein